jgi:hypothetical protein
MKLAMPKLTQTLIMGDEVSGQHGDGKERVLRLLIAVPITVLKACVKYNVYAPCRSLDTLEINSH